MGASQSGRWRGGSGEAGGRWVRKQEDNWGNQGNHGNEGYFQGVQDKTTNLPGEAAAARNLKPGK
jgi:hypothetical protein